MNIQIIREYQKENNAVFKLESKNEDPLQPDRTCVLLYLTVGYSAFNYFQNANSHERN
jgi:hypothetical protein